MHKLYNRLKNALVQPDPTEPQVTPPAEDVKPDPATPTESPKGDNAISGPTPTASIEVPLPSPNAGYKPDPVSASDFVMGDEFKAIVTNKVCPNTKYVHIAVRGWTGLALASVQDAQDWRPGNEMTVKFHRMRPDYILEFAGPQGAQRNKFGRRGR